MKRASFIRAAALLSAGAAALTLGACNRNGSSPNGAYVAASTASSPAAASQSSPPSSEYQAVADSPPPPLPAYDQPPFPGPGYIWTPGYWGWNGDADDYYWVPGTWIEPPDPGLLWTPGYWRFYNGRYLFSDGYWGPQVGFYGGVNYGYGYGGNGYAGGRWQGRQFYYNDQANNFGGRRIATTYSQSVSQNAGGASFNGGPGGLRAKPGPAEIAAAQASHIAPTGGQRQQAHLASGETQLRASVNRGSPPIAATSRPAAFNVAAGVTAARSAAAYTPPPGRAAVGEVARQQPIPASPGSTSERSPSAIGGRPSETPGHAEPARPSTDGARMQIPPVRTTAPAHTTALPERAPPLERAAPQMAPPQMRMAPQIQAPPHMAAPTPAEHPVAPHPQAAPDRPR
jgi:hypothetical protein